MKKSLLKNQSGQMILESILILTILTAVTITTARFMKEEQILAGLISAPWANLSGMIQNGVWKPPGQAENYHPSHHARSASLTGESPQ